MTGQYSWVNLAPTTRAIMDSRARYTAFVARTAEKHGFSWAYWQFDSDFIVYNIDKESWVEPILDALMNK